MLPLWFKNPADYDKISGTDKISILGLDSFKVGNELDVEITHKDGNKEKIKVTNSINEGQWGWFKAGSGEFSPSDSHSPRHQPCLVSKSADMCGLALNMMASHAKQ